ncbi:MAG: RNA polymerase sigma factor, partial [Planctomycetota bacterium]
LLAEQGWMRSLALALLRDAQVADDVVQDAVLTALQRPPRAGLPLRPWLRTVVRNAARKRAERERYRRTDALDPEAASEAPSAAELNVRAELQELVVGLVRELDEPYRSTVLLRFFEGLEPTEIAQRDGVPAGTVRWRLKVGLDTVRERLDERHRGDRRAWASALVPYLRHEPKAASGLAASTLSALLAMPTAIHAILLSLPIVAGGAFLLNSPAEPPAPASSVAGVSSVPTSPAAPVAAAVPAIDDEETARRAVEGSVEDELFSGDLEAYIRQQIAAGWRSAREDEAPDEVVDKGFAEVVSLIQSAPSVIGRRQAEAKTKNDLAGDVPIVALLERLDAGELANPTERVLNGAEFAKNFEPKREGPTVDLTAYLSDRDRPLQDGTTYVLPAGVFLLDNFMHNVNSFPRDVTIVGAGKDATLLLIDDEWYTRSPVVNFGLVNLTAHTMNDYLFDLRHEPATVYMEGVRLIGFDMGAGGSCAFGTKELALLAKDCEFVGGYGRSPQHGQLFRVETDGLVARFERCVFDTVNISPSRVRSGAAVAFVDCRGIDLLDSQDRFGQQFASNPALVERGFNRSFFDRYPEPGQRVYPEPKDLNALFPDWEARIQR